LIEKWTDAVCTTLPVWVDKKEYSSCFHCKKKFARGHQHHCRLCGQMFCSVCTLKLYVPKKLQGKDKDGPTRVCFACRDICFQAREAAKQDLVNERRVLLNYTIDRSSGKRFLHPPSSLLDREIYFSCGISGIRAASKDLFPCPVCGDVVAADNLTSDVLIPKDFPRAGKASKICKQCRFYVISGAELIAKLPSKDTEYYGLKAIAIANGMQISEPFSISSISPFHASSDASIPEPSRALSVSREGESSDDDKIEDDRSTLASRGRFRTSMASLMSSSMRLEDGEKRGIPDHLRISSDVLMKRALGSRAMLAPISDTRDSIRDQTEDQSKILKPTPGTSVLFVCWRGSGRIFACVEVRPEDTLTNVYSRLVKLYPSLKKTWVVFMIESVPVWQELWDLITAYKVLPTVHIKEGIFDYVKREKKCDVFNATCDFSMESDPSSSTKMLNFKKGEQLVIVSSDATNTWVYGIHIGSSQAGWFPMTHVSKIHC